MNINPIPGCVLKFTYTSQNVRTPSYPRWPAFQPQFTRAVTAPGTIRYGLFLGYKGNDPAKLIIDEIDMPNNGTATIPVATTPGHRKLFLIARFSSATFCNLSGTEYPNGHPQNTDTLRYNQGHYPNTLFRRNNRGYAVDISPRPRMRTRSQTAVLHRQQAAPRYSTRSRAAAPRANATTTSRNARQVPAASNTSRRSTRATRQ